MPLPHSLARFNKKVTNRVTMLIAGWAPGFAIVHHVGRKSGNHYETPVNVFRRDDGYLFALTYGEASWVKNVVAAGTCEIETGSQRVKLVEPTIYTDPQRREMPAPVRAILKLVDVDQFLSMRVDDGHRSMRNDPSPKTTR